jgi:uncharacterized protein YutE (UPF0331/DUF86 family)
MYLRKDEANKLLAEFLSAARSEMSEQIKVLCNFLQEDDWSFVIKSHALLEAAVTQMLVEHLGESKLKRYIERLPLSDSQMGKIVIAKQLGLLDEKQRKFIRWFSELRNILVHKIENVNFDILEHYQQLDNNQKKVWSDILSCGSKDEESVTEFRKSIEINPNVTILIALLLVINSCVLSWKHSESKRRSKLVAEKNTIAAFEKLFNTQL